jgi:pimeloyl-ACP methyl ester carboxylesterase
VLFEGHEQFFDQVEIDRVPDAGHLLPEERPDLVAARTLEFVSASEQATPAGQPA